VFAILSLESEDSKFMMGSELVSMAVTPPSNIEATRPWVGL